MISTYGLNLSQEEIVFLFNISNGSSTTAITFSKNDFIGTYKNIVYLATTSKDLNLIDFIDKSLKNDENLLMLEKLIIFFLRRTIGHYSGELFNNETTFLNYYRQKNKIDLIFGKIDKISDIFLKINNFNLDKRQALINILSIL